MLLLFFASKNNCKNNQIGSWERKSILLKLQYEINMLQQHNLMENVFSYDCQEVGIHS